MGMRTCGSLPLSGPLPLSLSGPDRRAKERTESEIIGRAIRLASDDSDESLFPAGPGLYQLDRPAQGCRNPSESLDSGDSDG